MNENGQSFSSAIEGHRKGARGYYKLRKVELIHALEAERLVEQASNIFDESIPNDPTPVLRPMPWRSSNVTTKDKQNIKSILRACTRLKILVNCCATKTKSG